MAYMRITAVLQLCTAVSCHILRLKCKKEAGFDIQYTGKKLPGPHLAIYRDINVRECYAYCIHEERCKSVNINDASVGTMCELMEKSASDSKDDVVPVSAIGWQSHTTNFSSRLIGTNCKKYGVGKCKRHQICIDSCDCPGYECVDCSVASKLGYHCNVCVGDPCGSNGRCVEDGNSFKCICTSLFTGPHCRTPVLKACDSNPCGSLICIDTPTGYLCQ